MPDRGRLAFSVGIADCDVQTFSAGGKGGQNQNRRSTGVRVIHRASGARGESREERSQLANKRRAFRRMAESPEFERWARLRVARETGEIDRRVKEQMHPRHITVETYDPEGAHLAE